MPNIPVSERPDPVLIRLADTQVSLGAVPAVFYSRAIQVNDTGSLAEIGQFSVQYAPAYQRLLVHKVLILRNGQEIDRTASVNMRALEREQQLEQGMYGGELSLQMLMHDVRVGDTLWVSYTIEGSNPVFGKQWSRTFGWDASGPTELRRLVVTYPKNRALHWRQAGDFRTTELKPVVEQVGNDERLIFTERAIDAVEGEPSIPSDYLVGRLLQFSEYANWAEVEQWATGLFPAVRPSPALKALAKSLEREGSQAARAAAALRWVQNEVRYFSVSIGENSHRPQNPDTVLANRYGDCKDKSYLLVALLGLLGVEAKPMLVSAQAPRMPVRMLPGPTWFDHVIVKLTVDGKNYYVDPTVTGQTEALEELPTALAGGSGLVVGAKLAGLEQIPVVQRKLPQVEVSEEMTLPAFDGPAELVARRYYHGSFAAWARRLYTGSAQTNLKKLALESYEKTYPGVKLLEGPKFADEGGRFVVTSRFSLPKVAALRNKTYEVAFDSKVVEGMLGIPDKLVRNYPFAPAAGQYSGRYRVRVNWPEAARMNNEEASRTVDSPHFVAREDFSLRGATFDYVLDFRIKSDRVEAGDLPDMQLRAKELNEFIRGTLRMSEENVLPAVMKPLSFQQFMALGLQEGLRNRREGMWKKTLTDVPVDQACSYLAALYSQQDSMSESDLADLRAIDAQLPALAARPGGAACAAFAQFTRGMFKESVTTFEAGKLPASSAARTLAAWARLFAGQIPAAADTATAAYVARKAEGIATLTDLTGLAAISRRAGKPLHSDVAEFADPSKGAQWPRPILAMYAGQLSAEQLIEIAEKQPRDASSLALDDAWFHIGQLRLASGDRAGARRAFQGLAGIAANVTGYNVIARRELALLEQGGPTLQAALEAYGRDDNAKGLELLQRAANEGDPVAQFEMAAALHLGHGIKPDLAQARQWYQRAAEQGHNQAQRQLAALEGMPAGLPWVRKAIAGGNADAMFDLALLHLKGDVVAQDLDAAFTYALQAAEKGSNKAQAYVAASYGFGLGVPANRMSALFWARRAQAGGNSTIFRLQLVLATDLGAELGSVYPNHVPYDSEASAFPISLTKGGPLSRAVEAKFFLAYLTHHGLGVPQDYTLARKLYREAADAGLVSAWYYLAIMDWAGHGGTSNESAAIEAMTISAMSGEPAAEYLLGRFWLNRAGLVADPRKAAIWFEKAAAHGDVSAMNDLGDLYELGKGVPKDLKRAVELYKAAARGTDAMGFVSLASLLEQGLYLTQDQSLAYTYCILSLRFGMRSDTVTMMNRIASKMTDGDVKKARDRAWAWKPGDPLPGFNEASASPAGRE